MTGRTTAPTHRRNARSNHSDEGASGASRLRIRTDRHSESISVCRTTLWVQQACVREKRKKADLGAKVAHLLDSRFSECEKVTLVHDNLNTHTKVAFYKALELSRSGESFFSMPSNGSLLNIAECGLSCLTRQCLRNRRFGQVEVLDSEIRTWANQINETQRGADWQFQIDDARRKRKRLYTKSKT
ncbi:MAG: transposase [Gemmataceae bacterium]